MGGVSGLPTPGYTAVGDWCFCGPVGSTGWAVRFALALLVPALLIVGRAVWQSRRRRQVEHPHDDSEGQSPPPSSSASDHDESQDVILRTPEGGQHLPERPLPAADGRRSCSSDG